MKIFTWTTEMEALEDLPSSAVPKVPKHMFVIVKHMKPSSAMLSSVSE